MLDAIAQTMAEQAAKPVSPVNVGTQSTLVAPQKTVVPVLQATPSPPESISPSRPQAPSASPATQGAVYRAGSEAATTAIAPPSTGGTGQVAPASAGAATTTNVQQTASEADPIARTEQAGAVDRRQKSEQAKVEQRLWLKQRLAEIVAKEKPLKEAKLRANLEAAAIAFAEAGQFAQARQTAQDGMLSPDVQASLLARIDAIAGKQPLTKPIVALKPLLPTPSAKTKARMPPTLGRSLPSVLAPALSSIPPQYSYIPPTEPQYVSYSLNGFGRTIGGIGVVVDSNTPDFSGQWAAADTASTRFNAALWNGLSFIFPLGVPAPITSSFGWRVHPIRGDRRFHSGTDIGAPMGTPVLAAADGKVSLADALNGYGLTVILSHQDDTRETLYGHLSALLVKPGQWVEKGTVIGRVGSTGLSTGPHLHFELRQKTANGWQPIDPGAQLQYALARLVKAIPPS